VAMLTLVEADRQFFISSCGLDDPLRSARQTPLDYSICQYAVASGRPLVVADTAEEPDLAGHLAVSELGVAAYAGMPLITPDGWAVGTLCVVDFIPRNWTDDQLANLDMMARICMDEIRLAGLDRETELSRRWRS
jgi:GAF domain-containing protein